MYIKNIFYLIINIINKLLNFNPKKKEKKTINKKKKNQNKITEHCVLARVNGLFNSLNIFFTFLPLIEQYATF